jgi:predicted TIM-barrel fold metal-dependent hydrolase
MIRWKRSWPDPSAELPVRFSPVSNGEYLPPAQTRAQALMEKLANEEAERLRRTMGMSRREFVRSAAGYAVCLWAIDVVSRAGTAWAHNTLTNAACDLQWAVATRQNLPGEFVFDVQTHHIDSAGAWRVTNPSFEVFFAAAWPQAGGVLPRAAGDADPYWPSQTLLRGGREVDPIENLSRYHYLKELYLDSATNMCVLSAVPSSPDLQPLPTAEAANTVAIVNSLAGGTNRCVMHAFVMPNRGAFGTTGIPGAPKPLFFDDEIAMMEAGAAAYGANSGTGILRGWKTYCPWGDVPNASGWFLDDSVGQMFVAEVERIGDQHGVPKVVATHKGFALPGFDERAASPRDIGPIAKQFPRVNFLVYHSGYDIGDTQAAYGQGNALYALQERGVDALIKSVLNSGVAARAADAPLGAPFGNSPNVYAELGSVWQQVMTDPTQGAHLLGKLINYVGPRRVIWGTDALWYGSPHALIVGMRAFAREEGPALQLLRDTYGLVHGLEGDIDHPTIAATDAKRTIRNAILGRNAAGVYGVDPDGQRNAIACDDVQRIRDEYILNPATPKESAPLAANQVYGPTTRRELFDLLRDDPWWRGAGKYQRRKTIV